jgi:hypothetical protein
MPTWFGQVEGQVDHSSQGVSPDRRNGIPVLTLMTS